jgi:putative membrane protein insertion efficiency factor
LKNSARRIAVALLAAPVHIYRRLLSPLTPPACRFHPTCSAYALEALNEHGPVKGLALAARRLARCHPIKWLGSGEGFDPVPLSKTNFSKTRAR